MSGAQRWPNTSARSGASEYTPGPRMPVPVWEDGRLAARVRDLEAENAELRAAPSMAMLALQLGELMRRMETLEREMGTLILRVGNGRE